MKDGWASRSFESCIEQVAYTPKIQRKDFLSEGKYPILSQEAEFINGHWDNEADAFRTSRPVVLFGDHTQILKYVDFDFVLGADGVKILQPHAFLEPKFFYYQLQSVDFPVLGYARHYRLLKEIEIRFPPLPEQQRIVALLDEAFAGLATAKANAERNLLHARAAFESHLEFTFSEQREWWEKKQPLADLCTVFADGDWIESKDQSLHGIRLIQTGNVGEGAFKDRADKARYITPSTFEKLRCTEIVEGDCLVSRLPDPVGRSCILPSTGERMITAVDCTILRFKEALVIPPFFVYFSQSASYLRVAASKCTGTTRSRISRTNLGLIPVPVPPLLEQQRIVAELDVLSRETQHLTHLYERKLAALEELKKSLLHQAFNGEL